MTNERIKWIDALKFFAIFLVLWGHAIQHLVSSDRYDSPIYLFIYSFHMPLFMALSGFFGDKMIDKGFFNVVGTRFRQLLIPMLSADILLIILLNILDKDIRDVFYSFWFLKSAFVCAVLYFLVCQCRSWFWTALIIALIVVQVTRLYYINLMFPSFVVGALINRYFNYFKQHAILIFAVSSLLFVVLQFGWDERFLSVKPRELWSALPTVKFIQEFSYIRIYSLLIGLSGTIMFIAMFEYSSRFIKSTSIGDKIINIGKQTLGIYIFQTFILETILAEFLKFDNIDFWIFNLILAPFVSLIVLFISLGLIKLINLNKWTSFLFLGNRL